MNTKISQQDLQAITLALKNVTPPESFPTVFKNFCEKYKTYIKKDPSTKELSFQYGDAVIHLQNLKEDINPLKAFDFEYTEMHKNSMELLRGLGWNEKKALAERGKSIDALATQIYGYIENEAAFNTEKAEANHSRAQLVRAIEIIEEKTRIENGGEVIHNRFSSKFSPSEVKEDIKALLESYTSHTEAAQVLFSAHLKAKTSGQKR